MIMIITHHPGCGYHWLLRIGNSAAYSGYGYLTRRGAWRAAKKQWRAIQALHDEFNRIIRANFETTTQETKP